MTEQFDSEEFDVPFRVCLERDDLSRWEVVYGIDSFEAQREAAELFTGWNVVAVERAP